MATKRIVRQTGEDFKALTQKGARFLLDKKKVDLVDHIDDYAELGEGTHSIKTDKPARPDTTQAQLRVTYRADLLRPVTGLAERLIRHADFLHPYPSTGCLYDYMSRAAIDLGRRGDEYQVWKLARLFLQILDYAIESRGWNPEAVLRLVDMELRDRLEWGDW